MLARARVLWFTILVSGCLAATPGPAPGPAPAGTLQFPFVFSPALVLDAGTQASEPDIAVTAHGLMVCTNWSEGETTGAPATVWTSRDGLAFKKLAHPSGQGGLDCTMGADAGGTSYFADAWGEGVTLASSADGATWSTAAAAGTRPGGVYDRPWLIGGAPGHATMLVFDSANGGLSAYSTADAGRSWQGPSAVASPAQVAWQTFGNLARFGNGTLVAVYGLLSQQGVGVEMRDVWVSLSKDEGATWSAHPVAVHLAGNANNVLPAVDADATAIYVSWAQDRPAGQGIEVILTTSPDGITWSPPEVVTPANSTAFLPRVGATPQGPLLFYYEAKGRFDPDLTPATWDFMAAARGSDGAWVEHVIAARAHVGLVTTGGYGVIPGKTIAGAGRSGAAGQGNARDLFDTFGVAHAPDGRVWAAFAEDGGGTTTPRVHVIDATT